MPQPEPRDDDVFYIIGFTNQDILSGAHHQLQQRLGVPPLLSQVEVYSLDAVTAPDQAAFKLYGDFLAVYYLSVNTLALAKEHGIKLPHLMGNTTRGKLPFGVSTFIGAARGKSRAR
jgi:hypothetical protein